VGQALLPALAAAVLLALAEVTTTSAESLRPASSVTVNLNVYVDGATGAMIVADAVFAF